MIVQFGGYLHQLALLPVFVSRSFFRLSQTFPASVSWNIFFHQWRPLKETQSRFESLDLDFICCGEANQPPHMASFHKFRTLRLSINTFSQLHSTNLGSAAPQGIPSFFLSICINLSLVAVFVKYSGEIDRLPFRLRIISSLGFSRGFRSHSTLSSLEQKSLKLENDITGAEAERDCEEVQKIRQEFDAAKLSFLKIPEALRAMPKLNPEGFFLFLFSMLLRFKFCILMMLD